MSENITEAKFALKEKVLSYDGPLLYDAICLKMRQKPEGYQYLLHYVGWSKNRDTWVDETRVCKHTEDNVEKQNNLLEEHVQSKESAAKPKTKKRTTKQDKASPMPNKKFKRTTSTQEPNTTAQEIPLEVPTQQNEEAPKTLIIDEDTEYWFGIDKMSVLQGADFVKLPGRTTIEQLLRDFCKKTQEIDNPPDYSTQADMFKDYFNKNIESLVLYETEKAQSVYLAQKFPTLLPSQIYGHMHLLRCLTVLPEEYKKENLAFLQPLADYICKIPYLFKFNDFIRVAKYFEQNK